MEHAKIAIGKANNEVQKLSRILLNISAAEYRKRLLLVNIFHYLLIYGSLRWSEKMSKKDWKPSFKVQKRVLLRVESAYRIVSIKATLLVTGIPRRGSKGEEISKYIQYIQNINWLMTFFFTYQCQSPLGYFLDPPLGISPLYLQV